MSKAKAAAVAAQETKQEAIVAPQQTVMTEEKRKPGRPIVEGSARQKREAERAEKLANGGIKRGRPIVPESPRQQKVQKFLAKVASGAEIKPGRPKGSKNKPVVADTTIVTTHDELVTSDAPAVLVAE